MCILPGGGQLSSAAIVGQDGGVWAQSVGFPAITPSEVEALLAGLEDPSKLAMTGIVLGGEKVRAAGALRRGAENTRTNKQPGSFLVLLHASSSQLAASRAP